jgi:hypothetical protein
VQPINFPTRSTPDVAIAVHLLPPLRRALPVATALRCKSAWGVTNTIATDREEIKKPDTMTRKRPIEWKRFAVPDFIYFSHKRHIKAGLECAACHGDVASMKRVRRVSNLVMGWCVSCHRVRNAPMDCYTCHK